MGEEVKRKRKTFYKKVRETVWQKSNGRCWYCGKQFSDLKEMTIDHLVDLVSGGSDDIGNLVPACRSCNVTKHSRGVEWFRDFLSRGSVRFSERQIAYLRSFGMELPAPRPHLFYFEKAGLRP